LVAPFGTLAVVPTFSLVLGSNIEEAKRDSARWVHVLEALVAVAAVAVMLHFLCGGRLI